ncbi:MAG: glutaredoxin [Deltaproteobacteria bacterium]|nr:glutaredoxin [Deltaproteobacteria bacterium]
MNASDLTLYHYDGCGFCARVRSALRDLDVTVEFRSIIEDPEARDRLQRARGRTTVPVLHIAGPDGERWMPESADIVHYLYERFGDGRRPSWRVWLTPQHLVMGTVVVGAIAWMLWGG